MNKTVLTVATLIQPGKPLMMVGPYGSGKEHLARTAIIHLGMRPYSIYLGDESAYDLEPEKLSRAFKKIPGNGVLMLSDIQFLSSSLEDIVIHELGNPDRCSIITGTEAPKPWVTDPCDYAKIISKVSQCIQMVPVSDQEFLENGMKGLYKPLVGKRISQ